MTLDDEEVDDQSGDSVAAGEDVAVTEVDGLGNEGCEKGEKLQSMC